MTEERKLGKVRNLVNRTHAFVATPAYDGKVECGFAQSIAEAAFCCPLYQVQLTASTMGNGAFIDLARNIFVKMFLEDFKDATHLFFIDADLKFEPRGFIALLKANQPLIAGMYRRRQADEDYPADLMLRDDGTVWVENVDVPMGAVNGQMQIAQTQFVMHKRVPTGFMCIRRDVVEEMAKDAIQMRIQGQNGPVPRLFYTKLNENDSFVGEDYSFCDDYVARYKRPIPVIADLDFTHGGYECNYAKWMAAKFEAAGEEMPAKEAA